MSQPDPPPADKPPTPVPGAAGSRRQEPLPWQMPKSSAEDPAAPARVRAILASPSYTQADRDVRFLSEDDTRGHRLHLDYLKPHLLLQRHGVLHGIVVFGSTRIQEPVGCQRRVDELERQLTDRPDDAELQRKLEIARRLLAKSHYYDVAREFGKLVGNAGHGPEDNRVVVVTGGGPGMMEAANRGAFDAGAKSVGLNISLPYEQYPNPYITTELCFRFHYFAIRKLHFLLRARALVAFPGGYGTFDELFETLTLVQTRKIDPVPVVLVGADFWRKAFDVDFLVDEGVVDPEDRSLFWYAETAEEIWTSILDWYDKRGTPLYTER